MSLLYVYTDDFCFISNQCNVLGKYADGKIGLSDKPALLNPPCSVILVLFVFVPFNGTDELLFSTMAGIEEEPATFPGNLFKELIRSIGVLVLETPLLVNVDMPIVLSVIPTPIERAVIRVV